MSIEKRIDRWKKFYSSEDENKTVLFVISYYNADNKMPILSAANKQKRIDWAKRQYEWQVKNVDEYEDDSLPHLNPITGTEIFAEAFGCKVVYPENSMPFALPMVFDSHAASKLEAPKLEDTPLMMLFDIMDELVRYAGNDALVRLPDIQCPIDISALIWDKTYFYPSMIDCPEAIHELAGKVKDLQTAFLDEWFNRYGKSYIAHYPDYYMDGGITMSVDELGCVSPQMFREFFTGEINDLSNRYGGVGIHSCADSIHQWENLRQIEGLTLLNLHRSWDQIQKAFDFFKDTCVQMHYILEEKTSMLNITIDEVENNLPQKCKIVLPLNAHDLDHAKELADQFSRYIVT